MEERTFWRCTPRKLLALLEVHRRVNGGEDRVKDQVRKGFIDQVL
ncbi:hypothetical protein [Aneurinibacillus aneurinilyticus]